MKDLKDLKIYIVDMDGYLIRKIIKIAVNRHMVADNALDGCGNKEILLCKTKDLTFRVVIGGVKHLCIIVIYGRRNFGGIRSIIVCLRLECKGQCYGLVMEG